MALPYLIKHIYNSGTEEVIRRGKKIHALGNVELVEYDDLMASVIFRVKDDGYSTFYKVHINQFKDPKTLSLRCSCPYNLSEICRHKAGALFHLQDLLDKNLLGDKETVYDQRHTVVKMKQLELKLIRMLSAQENFEAAENYLRSGRSNILEAKDERVLAELEYEGEQFKVLIQKNEERNFDTSCTCQSDTDHPLCLHKAIVLLQLLHNYGPNYFDSIRNWDKEKNKLLALYGYSLSDDLQGKFEFTYTDGKPFLRVLDSSIKRVSNLAVPEQRPRQTEPEPAPAIAAATVIEESAAKTSLKLGVVITVNEQQYPYVQLEAVQGEADEELTRYISKTVKLDLAKFINTEVFSEDDKMLLQQLRKLMPAEVSRYLNRNSPFSGIWENIIQQHDDELPEETRHLINEFLHPKLKKIFTDLADSRFVFYLPARKSFTTANLKQAELMQQFISPEFEVNYTNGRYEVDCRIKLPLADLNISDNESESALLFQYHDQFFTWQRSEDINLVEKFLPAGKISIAAEDWAIQLQQFILPLSKEYNVHFTNVQKEEVKDCKPEVKVLLKEKGEYLLFQPVFNYRGYDVRPADKEKIILPIADKLLVIQRNLEVEKEFVQKIESLHSGFIRPVEGNVLALKGTDVLRNNWFFLFVDAVKEMNIPVLGFEALKNFRFNTAKPSTKIFISSNTDWFDAKVEILFGEQKVTVDEVKKALTNKQQFVQLQDGTLGILPEEWIKKYSLLFRVGDGKSGNMKLSKYHFSVIEELYLQRDEEELFFQLEEKYERLKDNHSIKPVPAPAHLKSVLRPYQESGFQWLNYLREVQWGGILADDMGLGKTIQALSFLHHLKEENGSLKALVVCPTTLMFNWQNEIQKFTPNLTFSIHHGGGRSKENLADPAIDVIITTYGTLRSDIKQFVDVAFDYVILDESQAIKNPSSKVTKAAGLLKARNRLCLSGTPLQNNTFDIFAQMNFLNPGMLGSVEFFKQEFSVPIDKFGEKEQKDHLRKLLYPFILRRTKEQVAKDLPEKQEMVLFCEMGDEQRKIYDAYRNDYRDKILGVVENQGIQKSQLTILQGLMKLRQICDSPAIVKEEERFPNVSVKLEEIGREITENISNHKALVFSQFLGMLALIKEKMKELGVDYEYFDGSSTVAERERSIHRFQNDENCRVFLISLKAGGVGLNLTAADYVYIVDPWWNPAVEQQAIDRTHRIGQTKNIFAYRMICTDTVEDKILKLQERKRNLAKDLITDDEGFVKTLTKEDVEYLFS
ncbi:MAG: SNF2 helicase associated domain-containing protein [Chitinophagaceae bacterium]|nr:SNF2 helicase associated domain-containing protein [Chitinophagaceae bacterium]MCA6458728.1 SNF2 helicase associated domain-containing protein [Chitinophagaceae bacterium]MCA6464236.1 SNF2 helicase associated domain-containing protein [Chitinophagaceae bacterium]MEA3424796.1 SNF2-related protein [Bacteroidota bacterium]